MPRQSLYIQKTEINDSKRTCFMNNTYPMDQFEFIEQKLQLCALKYSVKCCFGFFFTQSKIHIRFGTWSNLTSKVSGSSVDLVRVTTQP